MTDWKNIIYSPGTCLPSRMVSTGRYVWMNVVITRQEYNMILSGVELKLFCPINNGIFDYSKIYIAENPFQAGDYCFSKNIKSDILGLEEGSNYSIEERFYPKNKKEVIYEPLDNEQYSWLESLFKLILGISDRNNTTKNKVTPKVCLEKRNTDEWRGRFAAPISIEILEQRIQAFKNDYYPRRIKNMSKSIDDTVKPN